MLSSENQDRHCLRVLTQPYSNGCNDEIHLLISVLYEEDITVLKHSYVGVWDFDRADIRSRVILTVTKLADKRGVIVNGN